MKLDGEFVFQGPREEVWELLQDPEVLAKALPGAKKMTKTGDDVYETSVQMKVGPMNGIFSGKVVLVDKVAPEKYTMQIDAKGGPGFAKGTVQVELHAQTDSTTLMKYQAEIKVGGRLASVGQRLMDTVGKSISRQSLEAMNKTLEARLQGDGEAPVETNPPSEAEFARQVVKDVVAETVSSNKNVIWIVVVVVAIIAAVAFFTTR